MLSKELAKAARPLAAAHDLDPLMNAIGESRFVLLGEASHGTSEFYTWRAELSKRLIAERGFSFVAVEGDWPDCYRINRYVRGIPDSGDSAEEVLHNFDRWPTWMWANREVVHFCEWMRAWNRTRAPERRVSFYGLDVYSLWDSMRAVTNYLRRIDPKLAEAARAAYSCFEPFAERSEERRVGKECMVQCRSRWSPYH